MEDNRKSSTRHKEWRRVAKKERRRRIRRKAAQDRDADDERLRATLERSAEYTNWLAEQEKLEKEREIREQREHEENERLWLEGEVRAQKEWRVIQDRKAKARQEQLVQEEIIRKEFEAKQEVLRKKKEEAKRLHEEEIRKHEDLQKQIDDYIDRDAPTPEAMRVISESQSGKDPCPFFTKTGACRYGDSCSRNHRRVALSKIILVPGFYNHFSLEKNSAEYDTDVSLEFEGSETRQDFRDFYESVLPELKTFGRIKTLKYCCNTEIHLRGNLYVEYSSEREAARAWRKLKGRYWAQRQLNCEFVSFKSWRNAVCGMVKCPKGRACNFLHTFRNPNDEYDIKSPPRWAKKNDAHEGTSSRRSDQRSISNWDEWEDRATSNESRNWGWSDSPEPEHRTRRERTHRNPDERGSERRRGSGSERRRDESESSSSRSSRNESDLRKRRSSSRRSRRTEEEEEEDDDSDDRVRESILEENASRKRERKSRKRRSESDVIISRSQSDVRESKVQKSSNKIEHDHRSRKKRVSDGSKLKLRPEEEVSDENIDANSINSCKNVTKAQRCVESLKCNPSTPDKDSRSNLSSPAVGQGKQTFETPIHKQMSFAGDSQWDTTDSEGEAKSNNRS